MKVPIFTLVFLVLTLGSCIEDQALSALDTGPVPVGTWSDISYQENGFILEKGPQLKDNTYGFRFLSNGKADSSGQLRILWYASYCDQRLLRNLDKGWRYYPFEISILGRNPD